MSLTVNFILTPLIFSGRIDPTHNSIKGSAFKLSIINDHGSIKDFYRNFIHISRYARWIESENRRETWVETVDRYMSFMKNHLVTNYNYKEDDKTFEEVRNAVIDHKIMPSMRALMTAGPALDRDHIAAYNCSFIAVDSPRAFDEAMYILMNGTGVGFSVEQKYINALPVVAEELYKTDTVIVVDDSKLGWAKSYKELIALLYQGQIPKWDLTKVRPAGARLKTFGGRASGPDPLEALFRFTIDIFRNAAGRRIKSIEAHDLMCKIGEVVVVGGVRRSALISLSNLDDFEMAKAKSGQWWEDNGQRALANNSAVYNIKPNTAQFLREWRNLYESKSGERGIYNMESVRKHIDKFDRRDSSKVMGTNPCGEILLRPNEFCNLTEVVIEADDKVEDLSEKIRLATILGTWQSTLTNFKYIRKTWKDNCEEERLLGVSLTGIYGNKITSTNNKDLPGILDAFRDESVLTNSKEAKKLGINPSASITCVKPSGTVSQLTGVSSGIHPWYSEYYLRSVRGDNKDPLTSFLKDAGIPSEPDVMKPDDTTVFYFPIKAPKNAVLTKDLSAIDHLEMWKTYRNHWTEHNPSVTINVHEDEWLKVGSWVYDNFDSVGGVSFLPASEHTYKQAPYQEITKEEYDKAVKEMPTTIDWSVLSLYETVDTTTGSQELSCTAGVCEIVDFGSTLAS
jgi:ribonucleoside-triphosphate reductase (thioredoxin)